MLDAIPYPDWIRPEIVPGLPFRWYGLMYLVAFGISYLLFQYQVKRQRLDIDSDTVMSFFFWGIIGLLVGARLFATLIFDSSGEYLRKPWLIFWPFGEDFRFTGFTGMNYYGGLVGALAGCILYARVKKLDLLEWADMILAGVPLGYTFGRLGNFINAELYGRITTAPWGMFFPHARRFPASEPWVRETAEQAGMTIEPGAAMVNLPRHPTQLYEAFFEGIFLWLILWFIVRKRRPFKGFTLGAYVIGYGLVRFVLDYYRMPIRSDFVLKLSSVSNPPYQLVTLWNLSASQLFSLAMILGGLVFLLILSRRQKRRSEAEERAEQARVSMRKLRKRIQKD